MPNIVLTSTFSPTNAQIWNSDPVFGNGSKHQITATFRDAGGNAIVPAHTYASGTLVLKWHVATPFSSNWPYYFTVKIDANSTHNPFALGGSQAWRQGFGNTTTGPGQAMENDFVLPSVWIAYINAAAGGTLTNLINLDITQLPQSTTIIIDSLTLYLTYQDAPGSNFAKKWSAALVEGRGICTFVDTSGALQVSTTRSIQGGITSGKTAGWTTPYQLAPHAQDCNVGIHPGKGRGQIWYTQLDSSGLNPASVYTTSVTAGASQDWTTPTTITARTSYTLAQLTQPYSPFYNSGNGTYTYVTSQSTGTGRHVGAAGIDGRLYWYTGGSYTVAVPGGGTILANGFACKDNGIGAVWDWRLLDGNGPYNSADGAPYATAVDTSTHGTGKIYGSIVGGAYRSAIVRADNDILYQLVFSTSYTRFAKLTPRGSTIGANQFTNNINNQPPTSSTLTNHYTLAVPSGTDQIQYVKLNWVPTVRERANVTGTLDSPSRPTKVRFDLPALSDIPGYDDLGHPSNAYGGTSYLYASVVIDFVYIGATNLQIAFSHNLTQGSAGQKYPVAQQAKTAIVNGRGEWSGSAGWDYYGNFDIDRSRSSTIEFDVLISGQVDTLNIKSIKLHVHNAQTEAAADTMTLSSAQSMSSATSLNILFGGFGGEVTADFAYPPPAGQPNYTPVNGSLLDEINGRHGLGWDFDLTWTQANTLGSGGTTKNLPFDIAFVDEYATCLYYANQTDNTKADFFLVRSRDGGRSWEYAADGKPIAALSALRDWNNTGVDVKMPALVTDSNVVSCVWVESSVVKTASSQDAGETFQSA